MQKQYSQSNCSDNKYSIYSKSGRKLYHRINNTNIRVLNKSKLSNRSNNSIGSVALRRTQLSNDKIYSREEEMYPLNTSDVGNQFESGFDVKSEKKSVPMTPLMSNDNYRQRGGQSPAQRSLRSDSQKSSRYRPNTRKFNKNEIQKLLMLEGDRNYINGQQPKQRDSTRREQRQNRQNSKRQKESIRSSRQRQEKRYNAGDSKLRSIRTIKSSDKSNIKVSSSRYLKEQSRYDLQPQQSKQTNSIQKLSMKYNSNQNTNNNYKKDTNQQPSSRQSRNKMDYDYRIEQKYIGTQSRRRADDHGVLNENNGIREKSSRNLQKYQSEKYLGVNDSEVFSRRSGKKRTYQEESKVTNDRRGDARRYEQAKDREYYYEKNDNCNNKKSRGGLENSLEKYQKDTWARNMHRKNLASEKNLANERLFMGEPNPLDQRSSKPYPPQQPSQYPTKSSKPDRRYQKNYKSDERSSILEMRSKHDRSQLRNLRIREEEYGNLYGKSQDDENSLYGYMNQKNPRSRHKLRSPQYQSPRNAKPYNHQQPDPQYYHNLNTPTKNKPANMHSPQTQISTTFDSLMLSINSHVTQSSIGQQTNTKTIIDKINLHVGTLEMIADYSQEFKKMYEQVDQWEELIFMAYKKFWVERVKVMEYLKRFRRVKRHESQRLQQNGNGSKKLLMDNKLVSTKNICSEIPRLSNADDPFAEQKLIENPFIIPFCKVSQEQVKKVARAEEGTILLQKLQKQTTTAYQSLQEMYNLIISKSGNHINMLYCDNFSDDIFVMMLEEIEQLIPNLEEFKLFQATKIRLGKIVKVGILMLYLNGKVIRNIAEILTFDDCEKIGEKRKIKTFTTYDLYYEVFERLVAE